MVAKMIKDAVPIPAELLRKIDSSMFEEVDKRNPTGELMSLLLEALGGQSTKEPKCHKPTDNNVFIAIGKDGVEISAPSFDELKAKVSKHAGIPADDITLKCGLPKNMRTKGGCGECKFNK